ncbi:kinase-like domain-containing protein [Zopfochytrium polystomum]|nr:kinase-like domain-containing protein [Zopfochytrium polystomum]
MLGPYVLLKTIGEGEFGKVKLAYHVKDPTYEVAIKLIKKENIRNPVKRAKILREISILKSLDHPYIVRLLEVVETDQYIGMVMEYASGGELFEYILAHRYLKERDACRFFAQLLAGVSYIHSVGIVHRDLKLENLLLDSDRNVIITDFGFANRCRSGDVDILMQTSCGSPCYAAPELVVSEGYAGEAADIWSCGVILYAMLSGYLPFDDDPENPDGDNINLLYKYILETSLEFPDHISEDAKSLLSRMLVPDPRYRAKMPEVISHRFEKKKKKLTRTSNPFVLTHFLTQVAITGFPYF